MIHSTKKLLILSLSAMLSACSLSADDLKETLNNIEKLNNKFDTLVSKKSETPTLTPAALTPKVALTPGPLGEPKKAPIGDLFEDTKTAFVLKGGDAQLGIGGRSKIEHVLSKNIEMLNSNLPDEAEFFKHTTDLQLTFEYGQQRFGHKALEAFTKIRNKSVWGLGTVFADSDGTAPTRLKLSESIFGEHSHQNGKPLLWINEAWLQFSFNAIFNSNNPNLHFAKLGWFSFQLGRGIALGSIYGLNRDGLGLYSYPEDKSAPGVLFTGELIKDRLSYDLYYSKFQERNKSLRYTLNLDKVQFVDQRNRPWRGVGKDNEVFAGQVTWKPFLNSKCGTLELKPYVFYNEGSDQTVEIPFDTKMELGSAGLNVEHTCKNFEMGGEIAFNFGNEILRKIDRNLIQIKRNPSNPETENSGRLEEVFTHILDRNRLDGNGNPLPALVTHLSKKAARLPVTCANQPLVLLDDNGDRITANNSASPESEIPEDAGELAEEISSSSSSSSEESITNDRFVSRPDRFRPCFKNRLEGWMGVIDAAYTFDNINLKVAAAYGYASGDANPHKEEKNKNFKGFIGLHENYAGKRVTSIILLDERLTRVPGTLESGDTRADQDLTFSNLHLAGMSATWKPAYFRTRKLAITPNALFFWRAHPTKKFDELKGVVTNEDARKFMGTELNVISSIEMLRNLNFFANFALFVPGPYFTDISGVPMGRDFFTAFEEATPDNGQQPHKFRLNNETTYRINAGVEFKF